VLVPDDELTAEALAADPDAPLPSDARPLAPLGDAGGGPLLPDWYMPSPAVGLRHHSRRRKRVVYLLVAAFLMINAAGLCSTYGYVVIA